MINIAICDDEPLHRNQLQKVLLEYFSESHLNIQMFNNIQDLSDHIQFTQFHIIVLDIEMPDENGISFKNRIEYVYDGAIIFLTAYDSFIRDAFGSHVVGYLQKPIDEHKQELFKILDRLFAPALQSVKVIISDNGTTCSLSSIILIKSSHIYSEILLDTNITYSIRKSLKAWEQELLEFYFVRISKFYIVNLKYVDFIKDRLYLKNGMQFNISRIIKEKVKKEFFEYSKKIARQI